MSRRTKALAASFDFAEAMIKDQIDGSHKYVPGGTYAVTGDALKQYLAFAYREGMKYGSNISPSARGRGFPHGGPVATSGQSSEGKVEQKHTPGDTRIGGATKVPASKPGNGKVGK